MTTQTQTPPPPNPSPCQWCNQAHSGVCPHVAAIEYFPNGKIRRVEFRRMADHLAPLNPGPLRPIPPVTSKPPATAPWPWEPYPEPKIWVHERKPGDVGPIARFGSSSVTATMEDIQIMQVMSGVL